MEGPAPGTLGLGLLWISICFRRLVFVFGFVCFLVLDFFKLYFIYMSTLPTLMLGAPHMDLVPSEAT